MIDLGSYCIWLPLFDASGSGLVFFFIDLFISAACCAGGKSGAEQRVCWSGREYELCSVSACNRFLVAAVGAVSHRCVKAILLLGTDSVISCLI